MEKITDEELYQIIIELINGEKLPEEKKEELKEIVKGERKGIERWALEGFIKVIKEED